MKKDIVNIILGDSIAYGLYDNECFGWYNRIRKKDQSMQESFYFNLSIPAQSSVEILKRFESELIPRLNDNDIFNILFAFGIKDALKLNNDEKYLAVFKENITNLINIAQKYTDNICFLGILDVDIKRRKEYKKENINKINKSLKTICQKNNITYLDMTNVINKDDLVDGIHPDNIGHEKISEYIYNNFYKIRGKK